MRSAPKDSNVALPALRVSALRRREQHPNLRGAWGFDEGTGTVATDSSLHGVPLTVDTGLTWPAGHTGGTAIGNSSGTGSAHRPWSTLAIPVTIMGWARPLNLTSGTSRPLFGIWSGTTSSTSTQFAIWAQRGDFNVPNVLQGNVRVDGGLVAVSQSALSLNTWVHAALTYDGTTVRLFRDGSEVATFVVTGTIAAGSFNMLMVPDTSFAEVDDVRIYNKALTINEIKEAMNNPVAAP